MKTIRSCPDQFCEHDTACACVQAEAAARTYPSTTWGWIRCWWFHRQTWRHECDLPKDQWPPGSVSANEMICGICRDPGGWGVVR
jgi:hypothetical protein